MLKNYVKYTGSDNIASFGAYAWAAGIAFRDAVNAQVKAGGVNSVTRKTIFEQLNKIHKFDAEGMFAPIDLAGRQISNCSVTLQVKNGDYVRVSPTKPGTFKCWPNGIIERKLDMFGTQLTRDGHARSARRGAPSSGRGHRRVRTSPDRDASDGRQRRLTSFPALSRRVLPLYAAARNLTTRQIDGDVAATSTSRGELQNETISLDGARRHPGGLRRNAGRHRGDRRCAVERREAHRDRRGDHGHRDPRRGDRRRRQPDRARTCSRARRTRSRARRSSSTARRAAAGSPGARSWSTSTTRSSTPTPPPTPRSRRARTTSPRSARRRCHWRRSTRCATARTPPARSTGSARHPVRVDEPRRSSAPTSRSRWRRRRSSAPRRRSTRRPSSPTSAVATTTSRSSATTCTASTSSAATRRAHVTRRTPAASANSEPSAASPTRTSTSPASLRSRRTRRSSRR